MKPFPLPVRVAAGLVATAVENARDLPRLVVEFPVTAVSQALQASMRVQQKVTELAIKGDRALGTLRPVEDKPEWATFDDEEPPRRNGVSTVTELRPLGSAPEAVTDAVTEPLETAVEVAAATTAAAASGATSGSPTAAASDAGSEAAAAGNPVGPNALPGYPELTIPQLRARLRNLSLDDLRALRDWEAAHEARAPFVTMLDNRITTVTEG